MRKTKNLFLIIVVLVIFNIAGTSTSKMMIYSSWVIRTNEFNSIDNSNNKFGWVNPTSLNNRQPHLISKISSPSIASQPQVLVILAKYLNNPIDSGSANRINTFLTKLESYWMNASYDSVAIDFEQLLGTSEGWYPLPSGETGDPSYNFNQDRELLELIEDAVYLSEPHVVDYAQYEYILIWVNSITPSLLGSVYTEGPYPFLTIDTTGHTFDNSRQGTVNIRKAVGIVGDDFYNLPNIAWGKAAHTIGHMFGFLHSHTEIPDDYPINSSKYSLMGLFTSESSSFPSDLSGFTRTRTTVTGTPWVSPDLIYTISPGDLTATNVKLGPRNPKLPDPTLPDSVYQFLKVDIDSSGSNYFMVEAIQNQGNDRYAPNEGVLIYHVTYVNSELLCHDINSSDNSYVSVPPTDLTHLDDILYRNEDNYREFSWNVDSENQIKITITNSYLDSGQIHYDITVENQLQAVVEGNPDLELTHWAYPPDADSPHIWVDSEPFGMCEFNIPIDCAGNGDIPILGIPTKVVARVYNRGNLPTTDTVRVKFWQLGLTAGATYWPTGYLGETDTGMILQPNDYIDVSSSAFTPTQGSGFDTITGIGYVSACIYAQVVHDNDELDFVNNGPDPEDWTNPSLRTQENVKQVRLVDSGGSGGSLSEINQNNLSEPFLINFDLGNPFTTEKHIYVNFVDEEGSWIMLPNTTIDGVLFNSSEFNTFYTLSAGGAEPMTLILQANLTNLDYGESLKAFIIVAHLENFPLNPGLTTQRELGLIPFGGITIDGRRSYRTQLSIGAIQESDSRIKISGTLTSADAQPSLGQILGVTMPGGRTIRIDIRKTSSGDIIRDYIYLNSSLGGNFVYFYCPPEIGEYEIFAVYLGSDELTPSVSSSIDLEITEINCTTTTTSSSEPQGTTWSFTTSFGALLLMTIVCYRWKKKRIK